MWSCAQWGELAKVARAFAIMPRGANFAGPAASSDRFSGRAPRELIRPLCKAPSCEPMRREHLCRQHVWLSGGRSVRRQAPMQPSARHGRSLWICGSRACAREATAHQWTGVVESDSDECFLRPRGFPAAGAVSYQGSTEGSDPTGLLSQGCCRRGLSQGVIGGVQTQVGSNDNP